MEVKLTQLNIMKASTNPVYLTGFFFWKNINKPLLTMELVRVGNFFILPVS
jgi:hypothetical protein